MQPLARALALPVSAACLLAAGAPAAAFTVTGWFEGRVVDGGLNYPGGPHPFSYYAGAPVTGSFVIDVDDAAAAAQPFDSLQDLPGTLAVDVRIREFSPSFRTGAGTDDPGLWDTSAGGRWLGFWSTWRPRFDGFILDFESDSGALRGGPTPADYRLDAGTVDRMSLYFASGQTAAWYSVGITSFGFGGLAAPVPEPATALLFALGAAGLLAHQRRRDRTPSRRVAS